MDNLIIIEGAQGVGKTTITTLLREQIPYSNLYRLSGIKDKTKEHGLPKISRHYDNLLNYLENANDLGFTSIFDRIFTTEMVYSKLGYAQYDFSEIYNSLILNFSQLKEHFNIYFYVLTSSKAILERNLSKRDKVLHSSISFNAENSLKQQEEFLLLAKELENIGIRVKLIDISAREPQDIVNIIKGDINGGEDNKGI